MEPAARNAPPAERMSAPVPLADRLPLVAKLGFGFGGMAYALMSNGVGNLAMFVLNIGLGVNPALVGLGLALPRLYDAITDPIVGHVSDNLRTRFGRRKPLMLVGGVGSGLAFAAIWILPAGWSENAYFAYFLGMSLVFYTFATLFGVPWAALGYAMTPDYDERTRLMGFNTFLKSVAMLLMPWLYALTRLPVFSDPLTGARVVGSLVGVLMILLAISSVLMCPEKSVQTQGGAPGESLCGQLRGTFSNVPLLLASAIVFTVCLGIFSISSISPYILIYYIHGGDQTAASVLIGMGGTVWQVGSLIFVPVVTVLATRLGKRHALIIFLFGALVGNALKWFCYTPAHPLLALIPPVFIAMGFCALWVLVASMMADVCDYEELRSGRRSEGFLGAVFTWIMKMGTTLAFASSGLMLNFTGFQQALGGNQTPDAIFHMRLLDAGLPIAAILCAIALAVIYPLNERRSREIRATLEQRRGLLKTPLASD
jgi:GPH family glycoside/pentoside/hexuronide:cation symporter